MGSLVPDYNPASRYRQHAKVSTVRVLPHVSRLPPAPARLPSPFGTRDDSRSCRFSRPGTIADRRALTRRIPPLNSQDEALLNKDPYARMSDSYGAHADQKQYPRGTPYKKNPNIIDAWDPDEKPKARGEGARVSDVYGAHYRDPTYKAPRGGVALSAHGIPSVNDDDDDAERNAASARNTATRTLKPKAGKGIGGLDYYGGHTQEEFGKYFTNGQEFEGYYQGLHAGKKNASQFTGSGLNDKDFVDPYENYRGGVPRLDQRPLPKTMDMGEGVLDHMAPQRRAHSKPVTGELRRHQTQELERHRRHQSTLRGISDLSIQESNRLGVGKKDPRARPDDARLIKSLLPEEEGGEYKIDHSLRAKTEHSGRDFESHFSGVTFAPDSKHINDGIFQEGRFKEEIRDAKSHMGFKDGVLQAEKGNTDDGIFQEGGETRRGLKPGMYDREGRRQKPGERGATEKGQIGRGFIANESATNEGIFDKKHVNKWAAKRHQSSLSGAGMKLDDRFTDDGIFDDRHKMRGEAGKSQRSAMGRGIGGLMADESATDEGIFDSKHKNRFAGRSQAGNLQVGKGGMMASGDAVNEGIFRAGRKTQNAGMDTRSSLRNSEQGIVGDEGGSQNDMFNGPRGQKSEYELKGRASSFQAGFMPKQANANDGIFREGRTTKFGGKDNDTGLGPGMVPTAERAADGIFQEGRTNRFAGKDNETGLGPGMIPRKECASDGIFSENRQLAGGFAGMDTYSQIGSDMMAKEGHDLREDFASAYSEEFANKDTEDHFEAGLIPQVQWKGGSEAKAAFERRTQLKSYYQDSAAKTAEGKKLNFYQRRGQNEEAPAAGLGGGRFSRGGNAVARTAATNPNN